jgi:hypothetical protein
VSPTYSKPWKGKGKHRQCGHDEKACAEGRTARVWELLFNMMPVMGDGCDDIKINKQEVVSKFEEDFVSYDKLGEWEWESPSLVNRFL